jgi:MFS transporter, FSR family, fosmidomycin resistance protein
VRDQNAAEMELPCSLSLIASNLLVYGAMHGLVDAACFGILFTILRTQIFSETAIVYLFLYYNLIAFGLQAGLGFLVDLIKAPRAFAIVGLAITGVASVIFHWQPWGGVALAGFGNAMFHIGGGSICLRLTPGKASAPGLFVAPGALGVLAGTLLGKSGFFTAWPFLLAMAALAAATIGLHSPAMPARPEALRRQWYRGEPVLLLILLAVAVRSLVGAVMNFAWKTDTGLLVVLTMALVLGKGLGGLLADRLGWKQTAVASLALSIPLLLLGGTVPALGIAGMLFFNITMPITLAAVGNALPGRPGFAFGLTCLALLLGIVPAFTELRLTLASPVIIVPVIAVSAFAIYSGLILLKTLKSDVASEKTSSTKREIIEEGAGA